MQLRDVVDAIQGFDSWPQAEKIKLFGWFLHVHKGQRRFTTAQLRACYDELHLQDPESFNPFFKPLESRKPRELLKDAAGYYIAKHVMDILTSRFGSPSVTAPISSLLAALPSRVADGAERSFIEEAITCIRHGCSRAAIVLGWCAAINRLRRKIEELGFDKFSAASTRVKNQGGKYKWWKKEFDVQTMGDLQAVFDTDLVVVLEGMGLIEDNQAKRMETCFQYRCHSAHPGDAPIKEAHVIAFFTDIVEIVLANPKFELASR